MGSPAPYETCPGMLDTDVTWATYVSEQTHRPSNRQRPRHNDNWTDNRVLSWSGVDENAHGSEHHDQRLRQIDQSEVRGHPSVQSKAASASR